jgi:regulator of chromosome condensation
LAKSPSRKRGRTEAAEARPPLQLGFRHQRGAGVVLTVGQGDTGQLGLGEDVMEKTRPQVVAGIAAQAVDVAAGGMHTAVLDAEGGVWTFGCNVEGSVGRVVEEEEEGFLPGRVALPAAVAMISCGDSHTAALTREGAVWAWGTFRDSSGPIGLVVEGRLQKEPVAVLPGVEVVRIASGSDHLVMLTRDGELYSMGNAEQGQLGRWAVVYLLPFPCHLPLPPALTTCPDHLP